MIKKRILLVALMLVLAGRILADEGMWLPLLLGQQVYSDMVKKGLKLTKEQLYSINKACLKDAVIIFGGGCTGEIVSPEGLIFTNHHCGYDVIASASSVDHNYLRDGFYARNRGEEIPAEGLSVQFLLRIDDVTREVLDSLGDLGGMERMQRQQRVIAAINSRLSDSTRSIEARVSPLFKGNQFLVFLYQRYRDIRLVGAPPESVGKFGGDTDNWEWPRHTGDISIFRVYMSRDGKPAPYSTDNVPLKPKYYLPISLRGVREGDFAMIYGYPGSTNRYETSFGVRQKIDIDNPTLVKLRGVRLKFMFEQMKQDPAVKLQLASSYAGIANYWKFYDGETRQLVKYDIYDQKKQQEAAFAAWAKGKPRYEHLFDDWARAYDAWRPYSRQRVYLLEGIFGSPLIGFASTLLQVENALVSTHSTAADVRKAVAAADQKRRQFLQEENKPSDQNILAAVLQLFYEDIVQDQQPAGFYYALKNQYGSLKEAATYQQYAADVFARTMIFDEAKWNAFVANPDAVKLQDDPAFACASAFYTNYMSKYAPYYQQFMVSNNDLGRLYLQGILAMDTVRARKMYPDATFTMRVTYGVVKSYRPRDAVTYDCVTTARGILEKYVPGDYEFDLPARQIDLFRKRDFGPYIDNQRHDLVTDFIATTDITGGNSGSPVLNGRGELIGLAFDGNYEALSHKIAFDKDLNRTICVDIRYVLWCIDKLGGAANIISELKLVK